MSPEIDEKVDIETVENSVPTPPSEEDLAPVVTAKTWLVVFVS